MDRRSYGAGSPRNGISCGSSFCTGLFGKETARDVVGIIVKTLMRRQGCMYLRVRGVRHGRQSHLDQTAAPRRFPEPVEREPVQHDHDRDRDHHGRAAHHERDARPAPDRGYRLVHRQRVLRPNQRRSAKEQPFSTRRPADAKHHSRHRRDGDERRSVAVRSSRLPLLYRSAHHMGMSFRISITTPPFSFFCASYLPRETKTQIPSSVNRVYTIAYPNVMNFALNYVASFVFPLQAFWNVIVYIITSQSACRNLWRNLTLRALCSSSSSSPSLPPPANGRRDHLIMGKPKRIRSIHGVDLPSSSSITTLKRDRESSSTGDAGDGQELQDMQRPSRWSVISKGRR